MSTRDTTLTGRLTPSFTGLLTTIVLLVALPAALLLFVGGLAGTAACPTTGTGTTTPGAQTDDIADLDAEQLRVAQQIVAAVEAFPATRTARRAAVIALATARQESGIRNLTYGDRDSLGAFQQRPSQGWGTPEQILDVTYATTSFLQHLILVPDWDSMPLTVAAATVQRPAEEYEGLYAQWEPLATEITDVLWPESTPTTFSTTPSTAPTTPGGGQQAGQGTGHGVGHGAGQAGAHGATHLTTALTTGLTTSLTTSVSEVAGTACAIGPAQTTAGVVSWPVPAELAIADQHNWGQQGGSWSSWHTGTDFSVACGTPVLAATDGAIEVDPGPSWFGDWLVKVSTAPGGLSTWYAHMQSVTVAPGSTVTAGQQIGEVGAQGNASGCHLHFEVHLEGGDIYGPDNVDPSQWLASHVGTALGGPASPPTGPVTARVATYNVLGASHTAPGGNSSNPNDGPTRMRWAVDAFDDLGMDIVGMQEFEPPQERAFETLTAGAWNHFPKSGGHPGSANVVAWRTDRWSVIARNRLPVPYFGGQAVGMPYVLLENTDGARLWVLSVHNPADTRGPAQQWRDEATQAEIDLVADLSADGTPVLLTGDMNERQRFFCAIAATGTLHSANGGEPGPPCQPPPDMAIDWIIGTPDVSFSGYTLTRRAPLDRASDHPLIYTDVHANADADVDVDVDVD